MKLARLLCLLSIAVGLIAQTPTWDSSGNGMLKGTYYFRHVTFLLATDGSGQLSEAFALYGSVNFSGSGTYSISGIASQGSTGQAGNFTANGTYSIAASGQGFLSNPLATSDLIYGTVNAQGIFAGSSTENTNLYNDLFIAAPIPSPAPTAGSFKGTYSLAYIDFSSGTPTSTTAGMLTMTPDGAGNLGAVGFTGYVGASARLVQSLPNVKYTFSNGAGVVAFPKSTTTFLPVTGQNYLYFSPDGNFVFGGSPYSELTPFNMIVGVRTGTGTPTFSGRYYEAGLDQDVSTLNIGYASMDSFYGSLFAGNGTVVGHERLLDVFGKSSSNYTYSDSYTVPSNGLYSSSAANYAVGNGVRVGSGIGPFLGISVALQAPTMSSSLSTTGVFLDPQGVVNAGSFAPFTAGIAPGELLTLYGSNLAAGTQIASDIPFPSTLGKVQVMINSIAAPLYYVTPSQLSAIVPYGVTGGIAKVQVFNDNVPSNAVTVLVAKSAPGVLTQSQNGIGYGDAVHLDGSLVDAKNPAQIGETVSVFLTGLGAVNPAIADGAAGPTNPLASATGTFTAFIGGAQATIGYAGLAPQLAGLYQINITIPTGVTAGDHYLDILGPDSYYSVCLIATSGSAASSSAVPALRDTLRALPRRGLAPSQKQ